MAQILAFTPKNKILDNIQKSAESAPESGIEETYFGALLEKSRRLTQLSQDVFIREEFVKGYNKMMFVLYKNGSKIGAATSLQFLRFCYSDAGAETAPLIE